MTTNEGLRLIAGLFVSISVFLEYYLSPCYYLFTAFVAVDLIQSAFSHWCPMMWLLRKAGLED